MVTAQSDVEKSAPRRKPKRHFTYAPVFKPVTWRDVVGVLPDPETRSVALRRFREGGFSADSFGAKKAAREAIADGLTAARDWLEYEHPQRKREHRAIRDVGRRLEWELWP